jgi:hypothetical protein
MRTAVCSSSAPPALGPSCCPHGIQNLESRLTRASANFNPNGFALEKWAEGLRQAPRGASWRPLIGGSRRSLSHISRTSRITPLRPSLERDKRMEWVFQKHHVFTRSAFISTHVAKIRLRGFCLTIITKSHCGHWGRSAMGVLPYTPGALSAPYLRNAQTRRLFLAIRTPVALHNRTGRSLSPQPKIEALVA